MAEFKRIMITVPSSLLREVDGVVALEKGSRSEFIREALNRFLEERKRRELRDRMKNGYLEMAKINLELAEEGLPSDGDVEELWQSFRDEVESD
ncbi:MAG: CopG family transcriptional regulator / antitoxin EndoAI [Bacillota bacterium]|nr:CopG family transcriptional regulator / antitoxin EndoAI [Bacillota bacterium]